jgi:hypothetical protein
MSLLLFSMSMWSWGLRGIHSEIDKLLSGSPTYIHLSSESEGKKAASCTSPGHSEPFSQQQPATGPCEGILELEYPSVAELNNPNLPSVVKIIGGIFIPSFFTVTLTGKTLKMEPGTVISLGQYAQLNLQGTIIESCDLMWDGISMSDHATLSVKNSQINDMAFGINCVADDWIYFHNSQFLRNHVTLWFNGDSASLTLECYGNTVNGSDLKMYKHPTYGIISLGFQASRGFQIKGGLSTGDDPLKVGQEGEAENVFKYCDIGVRAENSHFDIKNCRFESTTNSIDTGICVVSGIYHEIKSCAFFNSAYGIIAHKSAYMVRNNIFEQMGYCMLASLSRAMGTDLPTVKDNVVEGADGGFYFLGNLNSTPQIVNNNVTGLNGPGIFVLDFAGPNRCNITGNTLDNEGNSSYFARSGAKNYYKGITLNNTEKASVCDNTLLYGGGGYYAVNAGIVADNSTNCIFTNNTLSQLYSFTGEAATAGIKGNFLDHSKLDCNNFSSNDIGVHLIGSCTNTDIATQHFMGPHAVGLLYDNASTKQQMHTGNSWDYAPESGQLAALGIGIDVQYNRFFVDPNDGAEYAPTDVEPQGWFSPQSGETQTCSPSDGCTLPPPQYSPSPGNEEKDMILKIISEDIEFPNYSDCLGWMSSRQALDWIVRNNLQDSMPFSDYWIQQTSTSAGVFAQLKLDAVVWEQSQESSEAQIETIWEEIQLFAALDSLTQMQRDSLLQLYEDLAYWRSVQDAARLTFFDYYRAVNDTLSTEDIFEANQRQVNIILCDLYARDSVKCTSNELDDLRSIAMQCPLEGGGAVLQARGVLEMLVHENYDSIVGCSSTEERRRATVSPVINPEVLVSPNPNGGSFRIALPVVNEAVWRIEILDLNGRSRWQTRTTASEVRVEALSPGFYLLVCTNTKDGSRTTKTIFVAHP